MDIVKTYARLYSYHFWRDNGSVWPVYRQNGYVPLNYVVDAGGVIRYIAEGFNESAMREVIKQHLPDPIDRDVGTKTILVPSGSLDSGQTVVPACSVYNYGFYTETYPVRMRIGDFYDEVVTVSAHQPNTSRYVEFPSWAAWRRGQAAVTCSTELDGDDIKSNNAARATVIVYVYDLAVLELLAPIDSVDSGAVVVPSARVANLGNWADLAKVRFTIGTFYAESVNVALQPGNIKAANLPAWTATQVGEFPVSCSVSGRKDMILSNNLLTRTVRVLRKTGVKEGREVCPLGMITAHPSPFRDAVSFSLPVSGPAELRIMDATGRLIRVLQVQKKENETGCVVWDGRDDQAGVVRPGVYYAYLVHPEGSVFYKLVKTR